MPDFAAFQNLLLSVVTRVNDTLWDYLLPALLVGAGLWFTVRTRAVQVTMLPALGRILRQRTHEAETSGGLTPFEAFCVSTGARVGVGNIAGIALAVTTGGPGAVFWMWVTAVIGASSGFAESALAQLYKRKSPDGKGYQGGTAATIRYGLGSAFWAALFAGLLALADGLIFNSVLGNTMAISLATTADVPRTVGGVLLAAYAAWVAWAGAKRLAKFATKLVPFMLALYLFLAFAVTLIYVDRIPEVLALIMRSAFTPEAAGGAGLWFILMTGVRRGLYSHEAGQGTVPNAAAAAECRHPVEQGFVQAAGVYVDTLLICTATAMIVLLPGVDFAGQTGIELVGRILSDAFGAYGAALGTFAAWALFLVVLFFALTSVIGNFFYSEMSLRVVTENRTLHLLFRAAVVAMVFAGSQMTLDLVWNLADLFMGVMVLVNLTAILRLGPVVFALLRDYRAQGGADGMAAGARFSKSRLPERLRRGVALWD